MCCIFLSVAQFSKCGVYFQVFRIFQVWHSFQVWRTFPIVAQAPKAAPFFKCMAYSSCVEPNSKCGPVTKCCAILQVWRIFPSVAHFSYPSLVNLRLFPSVVHFSKCGAFYQVCSVFKCGALFQVVSRICLEGDVEVSIRSKKNIHFEQCSICLGIEISGLCLVLVLYSSENTFSLLFKYFFHLSHDVVTCDVDHDISTAYF